MKTPLCLLLSGLFACSSYSQNSSSGFVLVRDKSAAAIWTDAGDFPGVQRAADDLQKDITRVTGVTPSVSHAADVTGPNAVIIGSIGKSAIIDKLIADRKIDVSTIKGQWESYVRQVVANPVPGIASALVIAGSDKRGAIYGIYDVSQQIGVSPWYYWSDTPVKHQDAPSVPASRLVQGPPSVKYRGLFLNDEDPDLTQWIKEKYGTVEVPGGQRIANYGRGFYTNLFELMLRLKANYLWPAMWNNRFSMDDPENAPLADLYGVVIGTSHQDPMLRSEKEWTWGPGTNRETRDRNYATHPDALNAFWREGLTMNKNYESILTLGLRGTGDRPMIAGATDEQSMALLKTIVEDQRKLISEILNPDVTKVAQLWCPYKEVQTYYDKGFRVPDDVTILWAEDNAGNVRRLPTAEERKRPGGAGIYYHFDYHGGPRDFRWMNCSPLAKIWDQMSLARKYGADRIWIVNVGHLKGYELPLEYFISLGWDANKWNNANINEYTRLWAQREFGPEHAAEIADILEKYTKYNGQRHPELVDASTYSLEHYQEAERVVSNFEAITTKAEQIFNELPPETKDTYYQTVLFPTKASSQLNEMYLAANENAVYAKQGRASANDKAAECRDLFKAETNLMGYYNHTFAGGKWDHFMDEPVIGFTSWQPPRANTLSATRLATVTVSDAAEMGLAPAGGTAGELPQFDVFNQQRQYVDVFRKGTNSFAFTAVASDPWITLSETKGTVDQDQRVWVSVDWSRAPKGASSGSVQFTGANTNFTIKVAALNPSEVTPSTLDGFVEGEGIVSIEPEHFTKMIGGAAGSWIKIEDYGRTLSGMRAEAPVDGPEATPGKDSPCLEYKMYVFTGGQLEVMSITSPTLNFDPAHGLAFALSIDDGAPQNVTLIPASFSAQNGNRQWETIVKDNANVVKTKLAAITPGYHTLKFWMVDPGVVLQKIVVDMGGLKSTYLGPPESFHRALKKS